MGEMWDGLLPRLPGKTGSYEEDGDVFRVRVKSARRVNEELWDGIEMELEPEGLPEQSFTWFSDSGFTLIGGKPAITAFYSGTLTLDSL